MDPNKKLTPEQYNICFLKGTEPPGTGKYDKHFESGTYHCVNCGQKLFDSSTKYNSYSGWPAFWNVTDPKAIKKSLDERFGMWRTELSCANCDAHLGHIFSDGPMDKGGMHYCVNSLALDFKPKINKT